MSPDPTRRDPAGAEHLGDAAISFRTKILVGGPFFVLLSIAWTLMLTGEVIGPVVYFLLLVPGNALIIWVVSTIIERSAGKGAQVFADTVLAAGNLAPDPAFSMEEALIIRDKLAEAEAALHDRWLRHPEQHEAALRLAALLIQQRKFDEAEQVYLELRRRQLPPSVAHTLANRLIDLYHRTRRTDRLRVELARYSAEHKGTSAGEHAARRLREIKEQEAERNHEESED